MHFAVATIHFLSDPVFDRPKIQREQVEVILISVFS